MIEEIPHTGVEVSKGRNPILNGNRDAVLLLDVPFALQRNKTEFLVVNEVQQRSGDRIQRRCLVIVGIGSTQNPVELWYLHSHSQSRIECIFRKPSREVCHSQSGGKREPLRGLELVFQKSGEEVSTGMYRLLKLLARTNVGNQREM